ncbi:hypothetical protein BpHYR1_012401 [Brachionus plicatilis]|uniref:Uncharacterized protein n=1 Tax=Brachionus plicatilis TaxID=10195 RepID=A0A3M7QZT7_BRAPC|nr:hypothetical protein BpHYR1_012401 [Brachionus plicatilis]
MLEYFFNFLKQIKIRFFSRFACRMMHNAMGDRNNEINDVAIFSFAVLSSLLLKSKSVALFLHTVSIKF